MVAQLGGLLLTDKRVAYTIGVKRGRETNVAIKPGLGVIPLIVCIVLVVL